MRSLNAHIKINSLLDYSKKVKVKNKKLPRIIIVFNEKEFNKNFFLKLKIPNGAAILLRSYKIKGRKKIAKQLLKFCKIKKLKLLISEDIKLARDINADGVHFPTYMVKKDIINWSLINKIKIKKNLIITTAIHNSKELENAQLFDFDAGLLSPVFPSKSHPNVKSLGIRKFSKLVDKSDLPIYALGGINAKNIKSLFQTDIIGYAFQRGE